MTDISIYIVMLTSVVWQLIDLLLYLDHVTNKTCITLSQSYEVKKCIIT